MSLICNLILQAISLEKPNVHLISVDEKTGIQALERIAMDQTMEKGKLRRLEYEYSRHGTTCLMAAIDVGRGNLLNHRLHPIRNEDDFLTFIQQTAGLIPQEDEIIFMADQLNIHQSESLVRWIAQQIHFEGALGTKGSKGRPGAAAYCRLIICPILPEIFSMPVEMPIHRHENVRARSRTFLYAAEKTRAYQHV